MERSTYATAPRTLTLDPDVRSSSHGEDEQEEDEHKRLQVVGRNSGHAVQDGAKEPPLTAAEASAKHVADHTVVGGCINK